MSQLRDGNFQELPGGRIGVAGLELEPSEVLIDREGKEGWQVAGSEGLTVALDLALDDELRLEARVYDLIHAVNGLRKESGFEISDRIELDLPAGDADLLQHHRDWIMAETLAVKVSAAGGELRIERV
jgi:isoleucyl-tRNA synthetase